MLSEVRDNLSIKRTELDNLPLLHSCREKGPYLASKINRWSVLYIVFNIDLMNVFCLVVPCVIEALVYDEMRGTHSVGRGYYH